MFSITSYDVPAEISDRINAMGSAQEVLDYMSSVKPPCDCASGDPDLQVYWACQAALSSVVAAAPPLDLTDDQVAISDWALSPAYDVE